MSEPIYMTDKQKEKLEWVKEQTRDCLRYLLNHVDEIYGDGRDSGLTLFVVSEPDSLVRTAIIRRRLSPNCKEYDVVKENVDFTKVSGKRAEVNGYGNANLNGTDVAIFLKNRCEKRFRKFSNPCKSCKYRLPEELKNPLKEYRTCIFEYCPQDFDIDELLQNNLGYRRMNND